MLHFLLAASLHLPVTGPHVCQAAVRDGLLLLHSFVYEDARDEFRKAEESAPCPIAFAFEALTFDHPLWREEDLAASRAALARLPDAPVNAFESGFIASVRALFGEGDWRARHEAWRAKLDDLHAQLPADDEVSLYDALALIATADQSDSQLETVKREMQAAVLAQDVFARNPDHPGAAHYLIHAADSPGHAVLALKAARKYAQIAPLSSHALHMPSHIFVQLGMWRDAELSNIAAFSASEQWIARKKLPLSRADLHSFAWLAMTRLELGKAPLVLPMLRELSDAMAHDPSLHLRWTYAQIASGYLFATESWDKLDALFLPLRDLRAEDAADFVDFDALASGHTHLPYGIAAQMIEEEARLSVAASGGDEAEVKLLSARVQTLADRLEKLRGGNDARLPLLLAARMAEATSVRDPGSANLAVAALRALADFDDRLPPSGPAFTTPSREELGDLLMRVHRFYEAEKELRAALETRPNRLHALRGLAECQLGTGETAGAAATQAQIAQQLR